MEKLIGAPVDAATVTKLETQSAGWVTGLRLAALAMRHRLGRDRIQGKTSLNNRYVSEYLVLEILSQQSEGLADQVLKIAVLDRFCAELCQAVCDSSSGKGVGTGEGFIRSLEAANLFVIPLDDEGVWFRYHHVFRAFFQNELEHRFSADEIAILHCRASDWFAQNDMLEEAVQNALASQSLDLAARLVEDQRIDLLPKQKWFRIQNLLKLFPREFLEQRASLLGSKGPGMRRTIRDRILKENRARSESLGVDFGSLPSGSAKWMYDVYRHNLLAGEFDHLPIFLDRDSASIDVGAIVGQYAVMLAANSTHCLVLEPDQYCSWLGDALPPNCIFEPVAAGREKGRAVLVVCCAALARSAPFPETARPLVRAVRYKLR